MASKKEFYDAFFSMAKNYDAKTGIKHNEEDLQKFTGQINDLINTEGHRYGVKKNLESKINTMNKNILLLNCEFVDDMHYFPLIIPSVRLSKCKNIQ